MSEIPSGTNILTATSKLTNVQTARSGQAQATHDACGTQTAVTFGTGVLSNFQAAITARSLAETNVNSKVPGAGAVLKAKDKLMVAKQKVVMRTVQDAADADPANAQTIIEGCGFGVKKVTRRQKQIFGAKNGSVSGTVELTNEVAKTFAAYEWQFSKDGINWNYITTTIKGSTTEDGFTSQEKISFRGRSITKDGPGAYSKVITITIL